MDLNWRKKDGFQELFDNYHNMLCNYAYQILRNDMYSEDAVHEVFLHLWRKRKSLQIRDGNMKSYLFRATRNKALELIRQEKALAKREAYFQNQTEQISLQSSQQEDIIMFRELLKRSVRQLPDKCKEVY